MANADRLRMSYVEESTYGITPASTLQDMRFTSESLAQVTESKESNEIRDDRQTSDVFRSNIKSGGSIGIELSYSAHDDMLAAALCAAAWASAVTVTASTISASSVDNSFNDSGSGFGSLAANQWVKVSGFANAANNGFFKIVSKTTSKIVVSNGTLVTAAASPSITIQMGAQIVNGVAARSFSIEKNWKELTNEFSVHPGMMVDEFGLTVGVQDAIIGNFGFIGKKEISGTATAGSGYTTAPTNPIMNAVDHVTNFWENGSAVEFNTFSLSLKNNLRTRLIVALLGAKSIGLGKLSLTGSAQMYFESKAIMDKYLNFTSSKLAIGLLDSNSKGLIIDIPQIKYTDGKRVAGGKNTDIIADMQWAAYRNTSEDCTIRIARFT